MMYNKKRKKRNKKLITFLCFLVAFLILFGIFFESYALPYQANLIENRAKIVAEEAISQGVENILNTNEYTYKSFAILQTSADDKVQSISIDAVNVNKFKNEVSKEIQSILKERHPLEFSAPLGAFFGLTLFCNYGPPVTVMFSLAGSFNCKITSSFESAGTNQTVHHIFLEVEAEVVSTAPGCTRQFVINTNFEIAQTVIVGEVSNYYWGGIASSN